MARLAELLAHAAGFKVDLADDARRGVLRHVAQGREVALGAGASFVARSIDTEAKHLSAVVTRGHAHRGAAFIEILQNCPIYNDGIFESVKDKKLAADHRIEVQHGQRLVFGANQEKGIRLNPAKLQLEVVDAKRDDLLVHDESNKVLAHLLATMGGAEFPVAVGVLYSETRVDYVSQVHEQLKAARSRSKADLKRLLHGGNTWNVS